MKEIMINIIISKKSIVEAASIVSDELREKQIQQLKHITNIIKWYAHKSRQKQICKLQPLNLLTFINNVVNAVEDEKIVLCFLLCDQNKTNKRQKVFFRDAMTIVISLEKLVYLVKSIKSGKMCLFRR